MTKEFRPKLSPGILPAQKYMTFKFSIEIVTFLSVSEKPDLVYKLLGESSLRFTLNCETGLWDAKGKC